MTSSALCASERAMRRISRNREGSDVTSLPSKTTGGKLLRRGRSRNRLVLLGGLLVMLVALVLLFNRGLVRRRGGRIGSDGAERDAGECGSNQNGKQLLHEHFSDRCGQVNDFGSKPRRSHNAERSRAVDRFAPRSQVKSEFSRR